MSSFDTTHPLPFRQANVGWSTLVDLQKSIPQNKRLRRILIFNLYPILFGAVFEVSGNKLL